MRNLLLGSFFASIAAFVWGFVFWTAGISEFAASHLDAESEQALRSALVQNVPATGVYVLPDMANGTFDDFAERHRQGPIARLIVSRGGAEPMAPVVFILGFLHMWLTAALLFMVLRGARVSGLQRVLGAALAVGVVVALWTRLGDAIWFYHPWGDTLMTAGYDVVAFAVMGAAMSRFLRP